VRYRKRRLTEAQKWANIGRLLFIAAHLVAAVCVGSEAWLLLAYVGWMWLPESNYRRV
jgi:hypothetical protein